MIDYLAGIALGALFVLALGYGLSKSKEHYQRIDGAPSESQK